MTEIAETPEQAEARIRDIGARKALGIAGEVIGYIRALIVTPFSGQTERGIDIAVETTPLHTQKVDDADEAFAQLVDWVTFWAETLQHPLPSTARVWRARAEHVGFPAGTTQQGAAMLTRLQSLWLLARHDTIRAYQDDASSAVVYQEDVMRIVFSLRAKYPMSPRPPRLVHPRPCPSCGEPAVHAEWMSADLLDVRIFCEVDQEVVIENPSAREISRWLVDDVTAVPVLSLECEAGEHVACSSVSCACACHLPDDVEVGHGEQVPVRRVARDLGMPSSGTGGDPRACPRCWLIHPEGACQ